jgi:DNA-directed RNA polymerase specialized sigma24 family protein
MDIRMKSVTAGKELTQGAFDRLLDLLGGGDPGRAGAAYVAARQRLVKFFEWNKSGAPEEHADETINRVARKIEEGEQIRTPPAYFLGVARHVLSEAYKRREAERAHLDEYARQDQTPPESEEADVRRGCLEHCLRELPAERRELIVEYYREEKQAKFEWRRRLAERHGFASQNALRIRAHRIRAQLEACARACVEREGAGT